MKFHTCICLSAVFVFLLTEPAQADVSLDLDNKDNVVANLLEGTWIGDDETAEALGLRGWGKVKFTRDPAAIPQRVFDDLGQDFAEPLTIYAVGMITFYGDEDRETKFPYLLTAIEGNPNVVFYVERGGDPFGDFERLILMAFRTNKDAPAGPNDRLFIGGDFNNQAMAPMVRQAE
jgi:hypothetical protein